MKSSAGHDRATVPNRWVSIRTLCLYTHLRLGFRYFFSIIKLLQYLYELLRQTDVRRVDRLGEERGDVSVPEAGDAAANAGDVEEELQVLLRECDEIVHVGLDGFHAALHGGDGVALAAKTDSAAHLGAELPEGDIGGSTAMHASQVAAKYEDLIGLQLRDKVRREIRTLDSVVRSHDNANLTKRDVTDNM